ncbi:MAG TPA: response regulator [Desulfuromonadales bacterium]|nr:response regulator [Desulfuromonadales bacterium]
MNIPDFQLRSLKTRVTFFTLAIFVVGIWALSLYASRMLRADMQRLLGEQQYSTVSLVAAQVNQELDDRLRMLEKIATDVSPALSDRSANVQYFFERQQVFQSHFSGGTFVTRQDGAVIAEVFPAPKRASRTHLYRDFIATVLKEGKTSISRPLAGSALQAPTFVMATPVRDSRGDVIGVVAGVTDLSKPNFLDKITQYRYGEKGGYLLIAPQHNLIVTATDKSRVMQPIPAHGINRMHDRYVIGFDGYGVAVNSRGINELSAAKHIPASGWFVVAVLPTEEVFAPVGAMQRRMFMATILLTLLAGGLTWWMTLRMLKRHLSPMLDASKTLATLADTDQLPQPLPIPRPDEIGELIDGFNRLLETLAQRETALRQAQIISITAEHALRGSEQKLKTILEISNSGILITRSDGTISFSNFRMTELFGYSADEFSTITYSELVHPDQREIGTSRLLDLSAQREIEVTTDRLYLRKDDSTFWGYVSGRIMLGEDGAPASILLTITDITAIKNSEQERRLLEEQFHHSQKLESLGVLAGGIAHDFNNILTVILGHCYMGRQNVSSELEYKTSFQKIEDAANRASDLCRQMLTYAGKSPLIQTRINLWLLVDEVVKMLRAAINKNVVIETGMKRVVKEIQGDSGQLQQIIMNLIINAAEAIGDNPGTITVALSRMLVESDQLELDTFGTAIRSGGYVCLEVSDTGCGMDDETMKRIFEPFYTTKFTGRGLGMSAIRGIVKAHDGTLQLVSAPGVGTTFKVCFPVPEKSEDAAPVSLISALPEKGGGTILLVDDEQILRDMAELLLDALGFSALTASNGLEALEIYREHGNEIDAVLLDLIMPVMGGVEAYKNLRAINPSVPIIICSGYGVESLEGAIDDDDHAGFVHKPYKPGELRDVIMRMKRGEAVRSEE